MCTGLLLLHDVTYGGFFFPCFNKRQNGDTRVHHEYNPNQESELTPTGSNLLDGRYAVFGYIVDNYNLLKDIKVGDRITKTTLLSGGDALVQPSNN